MPISCAESCRRCMWSVSAEDRRALRRVVAADALEDAGAVVEAVRAHVDARVVPVDELAVHPDLLRGLHVRLLCRVGKLYRGARRDRPCAPRRAAGGRSGRARHVRGRAGADPDGAVLEQRPLDHDRRSTSRRERRDRARLEPGRLDAPPSRCATRTSAAPTAAATFALVGAAVARDEREHVLAVADEDERLDDLLEPAADRARGVLGGRRPLRELLDRRVDRRRAPMNDETRCTGSGHIGGHRLRRGRAARTPRTRAATATPRSMSAPSSVSDSSTAASATAMSKTSNQPMWPMRKIFPFRSPWPGASVTPCLSRRWRSSAVPSTPSGARTAVTTAEVSSSGEKSSRPIALMPGARGAAEADVPLERRPRGRRRGSSRARRRGPRISETAGVNAASKTSCAFRVARQSK